ncbi:hypothetical protein CMV_000774 [Castanea mollissima]|uniref:Uncharacterized protein n=1 Tax=Castanea mollissima TaxID=60419 RepID=A0A8J4S3B2_9ROSI|nr:hypothetical protein CMV_000774 [Castanea mollissima]
MAKKPASSIFDTLKRYIKKPWEFTGPQSHPEFRHSILPATQYRVESPASTKLKPWIPTSNPETVFDIKPSQTLSRCCGGGGLGYSWWRIPEIGLDCGEMVVLRSSVCFSLSCSMTEGAVLVLLV